MKKIFIILIFSIFLISCHEEPSNCSNFKTGTFKYANNNPNEVIITRTDSTQIEINKKYNTKVISSVKWLSDCRYIITPKEFINYPQIPESKPIEVKIIETKNNHYKCIASNDSISFKIEMIKIK